MKQELITSILILLLAWPARWTKPTSEVGNGSRCLRPVAAKERAEDKENGSNRRIQQPAAYPLFGDWENGVFWIAPYGRGVSPGTKEADRIIEDLKSRDWKTREVAAKTLGRIRETRAVGPLIELLKDELVSSSAAWALGQLQDVRAAEPLTQLLKDRQVFVRLSAAEALGQLKDARATEPLIELLKDKEMFFRQSAAKALGQLKDARAVEPLIKLLKDESALVRQSAAKALGQLQDARAVGPLIELLKDEDAGVRSSAADALGQLQDAKAQIYSALFMGNENSVRFVEREIKTSGAACIDVVVQALKIRYTRDTAIKILRDIQDARAVGPLIELLKDELVSSSAAWALGQLQDAKARIYTALYRGDSNSIEFVEREIRTSGTAYLDAVIEALKISCTRCTAIRVLRDIKDAKTVEPLVGLLEDENDGIRRQTAEALGQIGDSKATEPLIELLKDDNDSVRCSTAKALGQIGDKRAVEPLLGLLKDGNKFVRQSTTKALEQMGGNKERAYLTYLIGLLSDKNPIIRQEAAKALGQLQDARATEPLIELLKDKNDGIRRQTTEALGQIGDPRATEPLIGLLKDKDNDVRRYTAESLDQIGDKRAVEPLLGLLKDENKFVRQSAAKALGRLQDARAVGPLIKLLKDEDAGVRSSAADALGQLQDTKAQIYSALFIVNEGISSGVVSMDMLVTASGSGPEIYSHAADILRKAKDSELLGYLAEALHDENKDIRNTALDVLAKIYSFTAGTSPAILSTLFTLHPEWIRSFPSPSEAERFIRIISYLPPEGGKIVRQGEEKIELLSPTPTAEEQVSNLIAMEERGELKVGYVHQLTVQGKLPDEFKYVALALIINSLYKYDWENPFFETSWGKAQPLIHDGGVVEMDINPAWKRVSGRTDFLERRVGVYVPDLEDLEAEWESLSGDEKALKEAEFLMTQPDAEKRLKLEQIERSRLRLEARAYQRLALALHAHIGTAPDIIPRELREKLAGHWRNFKEGVRMYLNEYDLEGVDDAVWFLAMPPAATAMLRLRYEANYEPIKKQLIRIQNMRTEKPEKFAELRTNIAMLIASTTRAIDQDLGLLPAVGNEAIATQSLPRPAPSQLTEAALTQI